MSVGRWSLRWVSDYEVGVPKQTSVCNTLQKVFQHPITWYPINGHRALIHDLPSHLDEFFNALSL